MWINTKDVSFYLVSIYGHILHGHILHTPPFIPPSLLHPRITLASPSPNLSNHIHPFHLPFHQHLSTYFHPLSASFSFVGGERGEQEAVEKRRGKA